MTGLEDWKEKTYGSLKVERAPSPATAISSTPASCLPTRLFLSLSRGLKLEQKLRRVSLGVELKHTPFTIDPFSYFDPDSLKVSTILVLLIDLAAIQLSILLRLR